MICQRCKGDRILEFCGKTADRCSTRFKYGPEYLDYPPKIKDIADGNDYIEVAICLECGQVQGKFPKPNPDLSGKARA